MSLRNNSGRIRASAGERIAEMRVRMGMSRPPFTEWLLDPQELSLLPQASSLYNSYPPPMILLSSPSYMLYPAQHETLPWNIHSAICSSQSVCYWHSPQQKSCRSKELLQKVSKQEEEEEDKVYGQDDYNQCQAEIAEFLPKKGMVLKRLDNLDQEPEKAQLKNRKHE